MRSPGQLHAFIRSARKLLIQTTTSKLEQGLRTAKKALALLLVALLTVPTAAVAAVAPRTARPPQAPARPETDSVAPADEATRARIETGLGKLPLYFVENRGQIDRRVAYYAKGAANSVYFTRTGIVFELTSRAREGQHSQGVRPASLSVGPPGVEPASIRRHAIRLDFEGANPEVTVTGRERTAAVVSYFKGQASEWKTGLPTYASVVYEELWPGIDLVYGSTSGRLKYTFLVKPGADPGRIRLRYEGATSVRLTEEGRLEVETPVGGFEEDAPYAYQEEGDHRTEVASEFITGEAARDDAFRFGFRVGSYDRTKLLVLDPVVLTYVGYIGGLGDEQARSVAVDSSGNAYVVGATTSSEADFPETVGPDLTYSGGSPAEDAFIAKVNSSGTALVYCGYIGGTLFDIAYDVAVDGTGAAYVVGTTVSRQTNGFPVIVGPDLTHNNPVFFDGPDAFIAKVNPGGTALVYCGYIGGNQNDEAYTVAVDSSNQAYVGGYTLSAAATFPETVGPDLTPGGGKDGFVAKVSVSGAAPLIYCTYLGGTADEDVNAIDVDSSGNAYVGGQTASSTGFPTVGGPDSSFNGGTGDAFVTKIDSGGTAWVYSGFVGGAGTEEINGVDVDSSGNLYVAGTTTSDHLSFPVAGGPDVTHNGSYDAFVGKLQSSGLAFDYLGYIGGSGIDAGTGVAINSTGGAYVSGWTDSNEATFPVLGGPDLTQNGGQDAFVARVGSNGTALVYCGYIGGSGGEQALGIAVDGSGFAYVAGYTSSTEATFPETVGPDLSSNGGTDAFIAKVAPGVTAVELLSFEANPAGAGSIELSWKTGSELRNLGFHLHRASEAAGPYDRITPSLIPGLGSSPEGASYSWLDSGLVNGTVYFYKLEDVETTGVTELHGPVSATPHDGAAPPAPVEPTPPPAPPEPPTPEPPVTTPPARLAYGDPTEVSLQVTERTPRGLTLDLVTRGFYAEPLSDGSLRLSVPGFETLSEVGLPSVPVERTMIDALVGRGVRIDSVQARDVASFSIPRPETAGRPELIVSHDGTVQAGVRTVPQRRLLSRGAYPAVAARVVSVGFQGELKKALLELCPLRWDESSARLLLARRLRVRVVFSGLEEAEHGEGRRGKRPLDGRRTRAPRPGLIAHLATREAGLHALRFEQLFGQRSRGLSASALRLSYRGEAVAFSLAPDPSRFLPGSTLYFLSKGPSTNPYGNEAVYELSSERTGLGMARASASPEGTPLTEALSTREYETNRYYLSSLPTAPDPWLWEYLRTGDRKTVALPLSRLAPGAGRIEIALMGVSDYPVSPDHHLRAFLNGAYLGEVSWDGKTPVSFAADIAPGVLRDGDNSLELESVADTPASSSLVYLDRVSLSYPRALSAEDGRFEATFALSGQASVTGLGPGTALLDTTSSNPVWLAGALVDPSGLVFHAEPGHRYLAVSPEALRAPEVRPASPTSLRRTDNQADFILVAPQAFLAEAQPLLEHRRAQGLSVVGIAAEELYAHFAHGEARPEALQNFLAYAFHNWTAPAPRYVVLLGDASYDTKGYLGTSSEPLLPTPLIRSSFLWTASDPSLAEINGEDNLPDVAIGRLPASTVEEARSLVHKTIAWESSAHSLSGPITLVSDNPDPAGDFEQDADEIARTILASQDVEHLSLARLGTSTTRTAIKDAFERGVSLVSYIGHGAIMLWASEQLLKPTDVDALAPQGQQPLVLAMNCLNGYFHLPSGNSLSEKLLKADAKGAVATFSSSGMSLDEPAHRYHKALLAEITSGRHQRLGDALLAAQASYADTGADPELLALYHLLGDPALKIR